MEPSPKPSPKTSTVKAPGTPVKTATTFAATAIRSPGSSRIRRKAEESGLKLKIVSGQEPGNFAPETGTMTPKVTTV